MAAPLQTPGVYVIEKNAFPNSVVEVATAVPVFIGHTQKATYNDRDLTMKPTRVMSMAEFEMYFGGGAFVPFELKESGEDLINPDDNPIVGYTTLKLFDNKDYTLAPTTKLYYLYNSIRLFYQNGGATCYIISVGPYNVATPSSKDNFMLAIDSLDYEPEPTMIVCPDAFRLPETDYYAVAQYMLMHCGKAQSRIALLDIYKGAVTKTGDDTNKSVKEFRTNIGQNNLNYGACYFPWLETSIVSVNDVTFQYFNAVLLNTIKQESIGIDDAGQPLLLEGLKLQVLPSLRVEIGKAEEVQDAGQTLIDAVAKDTTEGIGAKALINKVCAVQDALIAAVAKDIAPETGAKALIDQHKYLKDLTDEAQIETAKVKAILDLESTPGVVKTALDADPDVKAERVKAALASSVISINQEVTSYKESIAVQENLYKTRVKNNDAFLKRTAVSIITLALERVNTLPGTEVVSDYEPIEATVIHNSLVASSKSYAAITKAIARYINTMPASAAMAGVYTSVDNSRGVWKAPANVSLNSVIKPTVSLSDNDQQNLNVDAISGKSINAIRPFTGLGVLVWGARTLDGNSQDWRYINVRRTMIMIEQSVKLAARSYVFEPNDSGTWVTVKSMIENFLFNLWKQGALAGTKPEDAYQVSIGLGKTMTADDILNGIMNVTVLVAIVRPAEFIVLTFQQQMQKS